MIDSPTWLEGVHRRAKQAKGKNGDWRFYHGLPALEVIGFRWWRQWDSNEPHGRDWCQWPTEYQHHGAVAVFHEARDPMTEEERQREIEALSQCIGWASGLAEMGVDGAAEMLEGLMGNLIDEQADWVDL